MIERPALGVVLKSERRPWIVDQFLEAVKSDEIFQTLDCRNKKGAYIKQCMHQLSKRGLVGIRGRPSPGAKDITLKPRAADLLMWQGDAKTTINHVRFLGAQHRPDLKVLIDGLRTAIGVKRGDPGWAVREGIRRSLVWAAPDDFDFVISLLAETSKDKQINDSLRRDREGAIVIACGGDTTYAQTWSRLLNYSLNMTALAGTGRGESSPAPAWRPQIMQKSYYS